MSSDVGCVDAGLQSKQNEMKFGHSKTCSVFIVIMCCHDWKFVWTVHVHFKIRTFLYAM